MLPMRLSACDSQWSLRSQIRLPSIMEYRSPRSFHLGTGELDDLTPLFGFVSDKPAEIGWRAGRQHGPQIGKPREDLGISERRIDVPIELPDDLGGCIFRRSNPEPWA